MCTVMFYRETLPAEKRSRENSQKAVDQLMAYDRQLSEPFNREELRKLFTPEESLCKTTMIRGNYKLLTDEEKAIVEELGLTPKPGETISRMRDDSNQPQSVEDLRREMKAGLIDTPSFDGRLGFCLSWDHTGHIYVWLDGMSFGNSKKTGFYYVRWYNSILDCHGGMVSTAYGHPALIVQKSKLRSDQVEYMDRKCRETLAVRDKEIRWG